MKSKTRGKASASSLPTLTVQLPQKHLDALRGAATARREERERPFTQQGIVEEAIGAWLKRKGFLE